MRTESPFGQSEETICFIRPHLGTQSLRETLRLHGSRDASRRGAITIPGEISLESWPGPQRLIFTTGDPRPGAPFLDWRRTKKLHCGLGQNQRITLHRGVGTFSSTSSAGAGEKQKGLAAQQISSIPIFSEPKFYTVGPQTIPGRTKFPKADLGTHSGVTNRRGSQHSPSKHKKNPWTNGNIVCRSVTLDGFPQKCAERGL